MTALVAPHHRVTRTCAALAALMTLCVALAACSRKPSGEPASGADESTETSHLVPVKVATVTSGAVDRIITVSGLVSPEPGAEMVIVAPQPARIARLAVAVGESVRRGDMLVQFDIPTLDADRAKSEAEVEQAQALVRNAEANHTRLTHLYERGIAAQKEVEDAQKDLTGARATLAQATRARAAADTLAARQTVRMPFNGVVAQRWRSAGEMVDGSSAMPVLRVVDPDRLQVEASIPPEEASLVHVGQPARIRGARATADVKPWDGKVLTAPHVVDATSGAAVARLTLPRGVAPSGLPIQADIIVEHAEGLIVPASAIVRDGDKTWCYVLGAARAADKQAGSDKESDAAERGKPALAKPESEPEPEPKSESKPESKPESTARPAGGAAADAESKTPAPTFQAERREVTVGLTTTSLAQITKGLAAGDRVITQGQQSLPDKATVRIEP